MKIDWSKAQLEVYQHPNMIQLQKSLLSVWNVGLANRLGVDRVWPLTQFYSVDFSKSRIDVKKLFSTNTQSRFASVVVDGVLGPPRLARHT